MKMMQQSIPDPAIDVVRSYPLVHHRAATARGHQLAPNTTIPAALVRKPRGRVRTAARGKIVPITIRRVEPRGMDGLTPFHLPPLRPNRSIEQKGQPRPLPCQHHQRRRTGHHQLPPMHRWMRRMNPRPTSPRRIQIAKPKTPLPVRATQMQPLPLMAIQRCQRVAGGMRRTSGILHHHW